MATRYNLSAKIDVDYSGHGAFAEAIADVKALNHELDTLNNRQSITVDVDTQVGGFERISDAARNATRNQNLLADSTGNLGMTFVTVARQLTAGGFLVQLAAIAPAAGAALSAINPLLGSLTVLGSLGSSAATGVGLLVAAGVRLVKGMQDNAKWAADLNKEWKSLQSQFTGSSSVFDKAAKSLAPLGAQILGLANKAMPSLGKEANEVAKSVEKAFKRIQDAFTPSQRKSEKDALFGMNLKEINPQVQALTRILDSASKVMGSLTAAAGKFGGALINIFGNRAVVKAAEDLAKWIEDVADRFLKWTQSAEGMKTINNLVKDARTFMEDLGKAVKPVADAIGKFGSDDVETLGKALQGTGNFIAAVIKGIERLWDWIGKAQKAMDKWNLQLKDVPKLLSTVGKALTSVGKFFQNLQKTITTWINNTAKGLAKWVKDREKQFGTFFKNLPKIISNGLKAATKPMTDWINSTAKAIAKWVKDREKQFVAFFKNAVKWFSQGFDKIIDTISDWADETADNIGDWINDRIEQFQDFLGDLKGDFEEGFGAAVDAMLQVLDDALGPLDEWVQSAIDTINQIFDLLGTNTSGDKNPRDVKNNPREIQRHGNRYDGGVYHGDVRYMAEGGIIDTAGVYTALTTGMDAALSQGSVWEHASQKGGISDGLAPRIVYGEGRPGEGPKREAWVPEDMEPSRAMDTLSEVASWFGAQVGYGGNRPHAHWLPEAERRNSGPGVFVMHEGGILDPSKLHFMAPIDQSGDNAAPNKSPEGSGQSNNAANTGGYTLGVPPPNSILNTFMEYIPGYPYGNEHHLGVDVVPGGSRDIHAPAAYTSAGSWDRSSYGEGQFLQYNVKTKDGQTYSAFAGHLGSIAAESGKPDQVMGSIGPYTGWGGGPDHLHLQTAPHASPVGMDPSGLIDPFDWWGQVGGSTEIPPGYSGSSAFDYFGAAMKLLQKIGTPEIGSGPYFDDVEDAAFEAVMSRARSWIREHVPYVNDEAATSRSSTGSGDAPGSIEEWAKQGLEYGNTIDPTPDNVSKIVSLAMKESGGDPNAVNSTSGASGLMQLLVSTFEAYRVASGDDIFNPVDNVAASSRYQQERYGGLVTFSPYTRGGIAMHPQLASIAEHGPEFFMPLHDPESSRRFMSFLEDAALEREKHGALPWQAESGPSHRPGRYGDGYSEMVREVKALRKELGERGIRVNNPHEVGDAAATGTISRIPTTSQGREAIRRATRSPSSGRGTTGGRISP